MPRKIGSVSKLDEGKYRLRLQRQGKSISETFYGTEDAARLRLAILANESYSPTLAAYYETFRQRPSNRGTPKAPNTLDYYDKQWHTNLQGIANVPLDKITHELVSRTVQESTAPLNTKRTLSAILRAAYDDGLLESPPFQRRVTVRAKKKAKPAPWTTTEAKTALDKLTDDCYIYCVLGLSGLRMEEALGLRNCDVQENFATIAQTYTDGGGIGKLKNPQSARTVPLLLPIPTDESQERIIPIRGDVLYRQLKKQCESKGLRFIPPSMLRHTSDTLMLSLGIPPDLNARIHGRSNPTTTYKHYFEPSQTELEAAMSKLRQLLTTL